MVMAETQRAGSGPEAGPEEEAAGFAFSEAIGAGPGGRTQQIWKRSRPEEKGNLEQGEGRW